MSEHTFCRYLLQGARFEAKKSKVAVPKRITAMRSDNKHFFVEMEGRPGEYIKACCAFNAKSTFIYSLVERKKNPKE